MNCHALAPLSPDNTNPIQMNIQGTGLALLYMIKQANCSFMHNFKQVKVKQ